MNGTVILGFIVALLGLSIITESILGFSLPIFKIVFGGLLIYWGLSMILGNDFTRFSYSKESCRSYSNCSNATNSTHNNWHNSFKENNFSYYKVMFGQKVIDLRNLEINSSEKQVIKIDSIFANTIVKINPNISSKIKANAAFGSLELPDNTHVYFGSYIYKTGNSENSSENSLDSKPKLKIIVNSIFSKVVIEDK